MGAFNTFSAARGKFANSTVIFPAHILPTCKEAVCCTPAHLFHKRYKWRGLFCPLTGNFSLIAYTTTFENLPKEKRKVFLTSYNTRKEEMGVDFQNFLSLLSITGRKRKMPKMSAKKQQILFRLTAFVVVSRISQYSIC